MEHGEILQKFLGRLSEAQVCLEQGLDESTSQILKAVLAEIERGDLPGRAQEQIRSRAESMLNSLNGRSRESLPEDTAETVCATDPVHFFNYGVALMDGQFWEEAIQEFSMAADLGFEPLQCWENCGDCAGRMEKWDEAIGFYSRVYSNESISDDKKKAVIVKITKCSQRYKKAEAHSALQARNDPPANTPDQCASPELANFPIFSLDAYSVNSLVGQTVASWIDCAGAPLSRSANTYRVTNLLHVGSSSLTVELEDLESGKKFAGQNLTGPMGEVLAPEKLAAWVSRQIMIGSRHLVKMYDLAQTNGHYFIVREHLPLSLNDLLATGETIPIPIAVRLAYQVLEALGDLHLLMGKDGRIHNQFHLDLRPTRVLLRKDRPGVKVYNGGLWKELENSDPAATDISKLPLPHLSYRAPEQFRPYLARKRPPIFTDIYLFGMLFYEILTGMPAFKASSYEEYEIQHCEQYPSPPRVWRPQIPDVLNELIMKCLESDPTKRWRSTSQMSILLEKAFPGEAARPKDDSYREYLEKLNLL